MNTLDVLKKEHSRSGSIQLCCVLRSYNISTSILTRCSFVEGNVVSLPERIEGLDITLEAEVYSSVEGSMVTLYLYSPECGGEIFETVVGHSLETIEVYIKEETAIIVTTDNYDLCDNNCTLIGPNIRSLDFPFSQL